MIWYVCLSSFSVSVSFCFLCSIFYIFYVVALLCISCTCVFLFKIFFPYISGSLGFFWHSFGFALSPAIFSTSLCVRKTYSCMLLLSLRWLWLVCGFAEKGFCMLGDLCPYDHGMDPVVVEDIGIPNVLSFPPPPAGNVHSATAGTGLVPVGLNIITSCKMCHACHFFHMFFFSEC